MLRFGALVLDPVCKSVTRDGESVELSAKEFAVLEALMQGLGAVLSREQLEESVYGWGNDVEEMHKVFDADLKNVAQAVASYHHAGHGAGWKDAMLSPQTNDTPGAYEIVTVTWTPQGERVFSSDPRVRLPFTNAEGLSRPSVQGESWIAYSSVGTEGVAQAAQRVSARQDMAGRLAAKVFPP